eukprot:4923572-Pleurochrysis_carterae.AAC.1
MQGTLPPTAQEAASQPVSPIARGPLTLSQVSRPGGAHTPGLDAAQRVAATQAANALAASPITANVNPVHLQCLTHALAASAHNAVAIGTLKKDELAWTKWCEFAG